MSEPLTAGEIISVRARDAADYERLGQGAFWHQSHIDRRRLLATLDAANPAPAGLDVHTGEPHKFRTECIRCGLPGMLHISVITRNEVVKVEEWNAVAQQREGAGE